MSDGEPPKRDIIKFMLDNDFAAIWWIGGEAVRVRHPVNTSCGRGDKGQGQGHCPIQNSSHQPHVVMEPLKCGWSKLRCTVSKKYALNFQDLVRKKKKDYMISLCKFLY